MTKNRKSLWFGLTALAIVVALVVTAAALWRSAQQPTIEPSPGVRQTMDPSQPTETPTTTPTDPSATPTTPVPPSIPVVQPLPEVNFTSTPGRLLPRTLHGLTIESVRDLPNVKASLERHSSRPTTRIVFQQGTPPASYTKAVNQLRQTSYIMGEILDSTAMRWSSVSGYAQRTRDYVKAFGNHIDIYEIGNELNGDWVGPPQTTNAKVLAAHRVVKNENAALNLRTAVTLNFWPSSNCYAKPWEDTLTFARQMPEEVRKGTDFLFLSFYETACNPRAYPTDAEFAHIFRELGKIFPSAKLGMGECGAQGKVDGLPADPDLAEKTRIARRYYSLQPVLRAELGPRYVGGYFWWYYSGDSVPYNKPDSMWSVLEELFRENS